MDIDELLAEIELNLQIIKNQRKREKEQIAYMNQTFEDVKKMYDEVMRIRHRG